MPNAPLKHVSGSTVTTVVDPRFGTGATPTQPAGWGAGGGGGTTPAPLTGDTYTAPGVYIPAGALDIWRAARDSSGTQLAEVAIFGDSTTYGAADPLRPPAYYTWVQAMREAAWADGYASGGFGYVHPGDVGGNFTFPTGFAPEVTAEVGDWGVFPPVGSRHPFNHTASSTTDYITFSGTCTGIRLVFVGSGKGGKVAYSVDGGAETILDTYGGGARASYEAKPVFIGGLSDGVHTVTIRSAGPSDSSAEATHVEFHIDFVRDAGLVFHKMASSGGVISHYFRSDTNEAASESMTPFWMGQQSLNAAGSITNARYEGTIPGPKPAYRNVKLAIVQFSTNDLGGATYTAHDSFAQVMENFAYFASTCRAVGCSGLIVAPPWTQLPLSGSRGARRAKAMFASLATAFNIAYADFQEPLGYDLVNWATRNNASAGTGGSHISSDAYQIEGEWLWNNLLAL